VLRIKSLRFRVQGLTFRVYVLGFEVMGEGIGSRV
jgi:hypothetical protein